MYKMITLTTTFIIYKFTVIVNNQTEFLCNNI